jgi:cytochrome oxidase Cu insertion factor (SCO1/SenC/PrrC family)
MLALERFRGRPVLVTFAFAHCETICPLLVQDAQRARRRLDPVPALVVITLDPWRDVPSRLPSMADAWGMGGDEFVVSGDVDAVRRVLGEWNAEGARDPRTGEVVHAPVTYVLDEEGQLAFATAGGAEALVQAVHRLR